MYHRLKKVIWFQTFKTFLVIAFPASNNIPWISPGELKLIPLINCVTIRLHPIDHNSFLNCTNHSVRSKLNRIDTRLIWCASLKWYEVRTDLILPRTILNHLVQLDMVWLMGWGLLVHLMGMLLVQYGTIYNEETEPIADTANLG